MKALGWFALGAVAGVGVAFWLKPASKESCCQRVAAGVRDKVKGACGPLGFLCAGIGDALDLWEHSPDILDAAGIPP